MRKQGERAAEVANACRNEGGVMTKIAIIGATGPTGIHLAAELRKTNAVVRVVARGTDKLSRLFPDTAVEKWAADIFDAEATLRAIEGCDLVYDCIGLPGDQMHLHPVTARNIAAALRRTKARCIQVSSYWAYYPQVRAELDENHPRVGGPPWARYRREAEDILCEAGAAILHLPDFYGPQVHASTLQNALNEAASAKTVNWLGKADVQRAYIFVPDAMCIAASVGAHIGAYGRHWCLPGAGPLSGRLTADIAGHHLGRLVKLRSAGMTMLRVVSLFNKDLRGFLQVAPNYMKPVRYDGSKLQRLLGLLKMTSYEAGIGQTLAWIASGS
jgi:nucleoside-diphosphate-sugar epimerase